MKKRIYNQMSLFGPLYAYLAVLSPPVSIRNQIASLKRELDAIAGIGERNLHSIGHITLIDSLTDDSCFQNTVAKMLQPAEPFRVRLKNANTFNHGRYSTLYLEIEDPLPIVGLMESLKSPYKTPHLSIAKRLPNDRAEILKSYLRDKCYEAEWLCAEVKVLRKRMSEKHLGFRESFTIPLQKILPARNQTGEGL